MMNPGNKSFDGFTVHRFSDEFDAFFRDHKVFIDTCSMLHPGVYRFWSQAAPLIGYYSNSVIIPYRCVEEIQKHSQNLKDLSLAHKSLTVLRHLDILRGSGAVDIRAEKNDPFADNLFLSLFMKFRMSHKLLLITQDNNLARDILNINKTRSVNAFPVSIKRLDKNGDLIDFPFSSPENVSQRFNSASQITSVSDSPIYVKNIPDTGDCVFIKNGFVDIPVKLLRSIASGGEGVIYETDSNSVAKIYKKGRLTEQKYEKLKLILNKKPAFDGICFPTDFIYNSDGRFVGYIMHRAKGKELQRTLFIKQVLLNNFPNWKKRDLVKLCLTILDMINFLHDKNILLGDINPANIMVVSPDEVYFIDTDSYQIESFPSPVGTVIFTAPEIQQKNFSSFLRSPGNENFAVATLLFMIMHLGKAPYAKIGGENPIANIINMDFSYPLGESSNQKAPEGQWKYMWSHLPFKVKEAFYNTFIKNGAYSNENNRLSVKNWIDLFKEYLRLLENGKLGEQDPMSEEIYPDRYKSVAMKCRNCGRKVEPESPCKYLCITCYDHKNSTYIQSKCIDCGRSFSISNGEAEYFFAKGFDMPKRCPECRKARKSQPVLNLDSFYSESSAQGTEKQSSFLDEVKSFLSFFK